LRGRQLQDFAIEVFLEEREEVFRKGLRGRRSIVGVFEDVVEEFVGKGGEVIDSRGRLRTRRGELACRKHGETCAAYLMRF